MAKKRSTKAATARPPLPTMEDADQQDGVSERMNALGIEYLRSKIATNEAKAAEKGLFASLTAEMHKSRKLRFWIMTDGGEKKWICIKPGNEKLKIEKVKTPAKTKTKTKRGKSDGEPEAALP